MAYHSKTGSEFIARDFADLAKSGTDKRASYSTALANIENVFVEFDEALSPNDSAFKEVKTPFMLNFVPEPISKILKEARENIESAEMLRPGPERRKREDGAIKLIEKASKVFGDEIDKLNGLDPENRAAVHRQLGDGKFKRAIEAEESMARISKSLKEKQRQNTGTNRYFGL